MRAHLRPLRKLIFVSTLLAAFTTPAWAQDEPDVPRGFAKEGGYAGISVLPRFTFDGVTFDGTTLYQEVGGEEMALLPKVGSRQMIRGVLGCRYRRAAIEVSYERVQQHGSFYDFPVDSTFQSVNVNGRLFFLTRSRVQPYLLAGGSYPWLNVKDGSFKDPDVGDAHWNGYGVNTEAGVTMYPHRQLGVSVGYSYRMMWFDRMTGVSDRLFDLRPRFRETGGSVIVATTVTF